MSGHNRWSKIKRTKGALDAKRGKLYSKLIKEITVSARMGGGHPEANPRLRQAITAAKESGMPKDTMEKAIKRGTGELVGEAVIEEIVYEGYGPGGVAVLVETTTDNKNRTVNDLRLLFKANGGNLGEAGSVAWMFEHIGQLIFDKQKYQEDNIMEVALNAGAKDVTTTPETIDVVTEPGEVFKVRESFDRVGMHPQSAGFGFLPKSTVPVTGEPAEHLLTLLSEVEDHDDVQRVHANFEMDDQLFAQLTQKS